MIGSIIGDIAGSLHEFSSNIDKCVKILDTEHPEAYEFTDDSVMTLAIADCLLNNLDPVITLQNYGRRYPNRGYGHMFSRWIISDFPKPYNSYGNGAAMRISSVGFLNINFNDKLECADYFTSITHNHPEGLKAARSVVDAMHHMLFCGSTKEQIKRRIQELYHYNLDDTVDNLRIHYGFDETSQNTIPQAFICFLESENFEDAIRNAISIGGDADTLACIVGGLAECFYQEIPIEWVNFAKVRLDTHLLEILDEFENKHGKFYKEN